MREDYGDDGSAAAYLPTSRRIQGLTAKGEDGIGGLCDRNQTLCLGIALWNGRDLILKERLFGLTNARGNHGEDQGCVADAQGRKGHRSGTPGQRARAPDDGAGRALQRQAAQLA